MDNALRAFFKTEIFSKYLLKDCKDPIAVFQIGDRAIGLKDDLSSYDLLVITESSDAPLSGIDHGTIYHSTVGDIPIEWHMISLGSLKDPLGYGYDHALPGLDMMLTPDHAVCCLADQSKMKTVNSIMQNKAEIAKEHAKNTLRILEKPCKFLLKSLDFSRYQTNKSIYYLLLAYYSLPDEHADKFMNWKLLPEVHGLWHYGSELAPVHRPMVISILRWLYNYATKEGLYEAEPGI